MYVCAVDEPTAIHVALARLTQNTFHFPVLSRLVGSGLCVWRVRSTKQTVTATKLRPTYTATNTPAQPLGQH